MRTSSVGGFNPRHRKHEEISLESRIDLAYEALLQVDSTIGYTKEKIRLLDRFRHLRSAGLYDGTFEPSASEVDALIAEAVLLRKHLDEWLMRERPGWMEAGK